MARCRVASVLNFITCWKTKNGLIDHSILYKTSADNALWSITGIKTDAKECNANKGIAIYSDSEHYETAQ
ncbi:hypothetical protein ACH3XW_24970 [Acanthocheilonema viteae]